MQKLIRILAIGSFFIPLIVWTGCSGPSTEPIDKPTKTSESVVTDVTIPEWFANVPQARNRLYAADMAESMNIQMALDMARLSARIDLAKQAEVRIERSIAGKEGSGDGAAVASSRTTSDGSTFTSREVTASGITIITKETTSTVTLRGARVSKQDVKQEGNRYRVYVLMEMPFDEASAALVTKPKRAEEQVQIEAQQSLEDSKEQAFREAEKALEEYEQWKKEHGE